MKWSGLGMMVCPTSANEWELSPKFSGWIDGLLAKGFTQFRTAVNWASDSGVIGISKAAVVIAVGKGAEVIWGYNSGSDTLTAANWSDYSDAVLAAALWAQNNGVYEFQIGNEEEQHNDDTTLTDAQLIINLKTLATAVQAVFTNGNVSYSIQPDYLAAWIVAGKGDLDLLGLNIYLGWGVDPEDYNEALFISRLSDLVSAFGVNGCYLSELSLSTTSLASYSTDEAEQAAMMTSLINDVKNSGITRAIFLSYYDDERPFGGVGYGVLKTDGTYRLLWNSLMDSVHSISIAVID